MYANAIPIDFRLAAESTCATLAALDDVTR